MNTAYSRSKQSRFSVKTGGSIVFFILCVAGLLLSSISAAVADSWLPPSETITSSENGRFLAHDIPGKKGSGPLVIVLSISNQHTNEMWRTKLINDVSPCRVFVSNDGKSVVTLDNWGGIGYGDDVVAIYGPTGLLAKYSLEQFAPPPKRNTNSLEFLSRDGYGDLFAHSTSSRHWQENSIQLFVQNYDPELFCLWLDWDNRWVAWRLDTGSLVEVRSEFSKDLNRQGRQQSLRIAHSESATPVAMNFLGRMRFREDRPLVEKWLHDTEFFGGSLTSSSSESTQSYFAFTSRSDKRAAGDAILSQWDGLEGGPARLNSREDYMFLGTLKCSVSFAAAPQKKQGSISLYLIPAGLPLNTWSEQKPEHYLRASLDTSFPYEFVNGQVKDSRLGTSPNFIIYGITPGRYRLKAVWNKAPPAEDRPGIVPTSRPGDYESVDSPVFQISKGRVTEGIHIDCKRLVP